MFLGPKIMEIRFTITIFLVNHRDSVSFVICLYVWGGRGYGKWGDSRLGQKWLLSNLPLLITQWVWGDHCWLAVILLSLEIKLDTAVQRPLLFSPVFLDTSLQFIVMSESHVSQCGAMLTRARQKGLWTPCCSMDRVSRVLLGLYHGVDSISPFLGSFLYMGSVREGKGVFPKGKDRYCT